MPAARQRGHLRRLGRSSHLAVILCWPAMLCAQTLPEQTPAPEVSASPAPVAEPVNEPVNEPAPPRPAPAPLPEPVPDDDQLQARNARIGAIEIEVVDVFDTSNPKENGALYRAANFLHIETRIATIKPQLLFASGDAYSPHNLVETARNLRARRYLADATVTPVRYHSESNTVDVRVRVHDVWTLSPGVTYSRSGGNNRSGVQLDEHNFLGWGKSIQVQRQKDVDRSMFEVSYRDPNLLRSRWELGLGYRDADDGGSKRLLLEHPFFSVQTRYRAALSIINDQRLDRRYEQGVVVDQYFTKVRATGIEGGWSTGLRGAATPWVLRATLGYQVEDKSYQPDPVEGTLVLPENTRLHYPWVSVNWFQDNYVVTRNRERIEQTEDMYIGRGVLLKLGYASPRFSSDRAAVLFAVNLQDAYQLSERQNVFVSWGVDGRREQSELINTFFTTTFRYDLRQTPHWLVVAKFKHVYAKQLDDSQQLYLGSDEGMRGYPLRYRSGAERSVLTIEQRYFSRAQILRLLSVGGAAFVDVGRIGGEVNATDTQRTFADVGVGLRLGNIRSSGGEMFHLDVAYPFNAPQADRELQFSVVTKKTF